MARCCPRCGSSVLRKEPVLGLAPFNCWTDFVCPHCGYRFAKGSRADARARACACARALASIKP